MSRATGRLLLFARALPCYARQILARLADQRQRPTDIRRILIAHHLLLGDTLMLTALLAALRNRYPSAAIAMTCPQAIIPLYSGKPYGVDVIAFNPCKAETVRNVLRSGPYDLGIVPGDNRHAWLALAAGCRWIVAHAHDRPAWKNWPVDEAIPFPDTPTAWGDMAAQLGGGDGILRYQPTDWPAPQATSFLYPDQPYVVLHLGASNPLRYWSAAHWRSVAAWLKRQGYQPVWSAGPGEVSLIADVDPTACYPSLAGQLDLAQLWHLFAKASALVCPDTGVTHLARLTRTPTVALFGQGSATLFGSSPFWAASPFIALSDSEIPCRNQTVLFRRQREWIQRCSRAPDECQRAICMEAIGVEQVTQALSRFLSLTGGSSCVS